MLTIGATRAPLSPRLQQCQPHDRRCGRRVGGRKRMREEALPEWAETQGGSVRLRIASGPGADNGTGKSARRDPDSPDESGLRLRMGDAKDE
jgi:hypothetical protein